MAGQIALYRVQSSTVRDSGLTEIVCGRCAKKEKEEAKLLGWKLKVVPIHHPEGVFTCGCGRRIRGSYS